MSGLAPDVPTLLARFEIEGDETPVGHNGYSGAAISHIEHDGQRFVLKRLSMKRDWIMRLTDDRDCREARFAASSLSRQLPEGISTPYLGAARDGDGYAILMQDIAPTLLPDDGIVEAAAMDVLLRRVAELHAWESNVTPGHDIPWCPIGEYMMVLSRENGEKLRAEGLDIGRAIVNGWSRFFEVADRRVGEFVRRFQGDPAPFIDVLRSLPVSLVHHDLKCANIGIDGDTVWLIDWAGITRGPLALDLGWMLAANSTRLPWGLDDTTTRYGEHLRSALGRGFAPDVWERQRAAAFVVGLLMFGWAKTDDVSELGWWSERALEARSVLGL